MKRILGLSLLIAGLGSMAFGNCSDADKKALMAFDQGWSKAGQTGDAAALNALYADDYAALPDMTGKASTIESTLRTFERNKANPAGANKVTSDHYRISCTPVSATITHRNSVWVPVGVGGKPETFYSRSIHVLEKRDGKWQAVSSTGHELDEYMMIGYLEQDWNDAFLRRDKEWFVKNFAADFSSISSSTAAVSGKDAEIDGMMKDTDVYSLVETTNMDIRVDGRIAVVTGIFRNKGQTADGKPFDRRIRYTDTWIKRDGRWQAWASQGTLIPEPAQTAKK